MFKNKTFKNNSKFFTSVFITGLFLMTTLISVGFAALNQNLNISGQIDYEKLDVWASNVSYDNTNTGVNCSTVQCMLDCLADDNLCSSSTPTPTPTPGGTATFSYNGNDYTFQVGTNWGQWTQSAYNTDGFEISGNYIIDYNSDRVADELGHAVHSYDPISAEEYYPYR